MKKDRKRYPINQSPLYKIKSIDSLAKVLNCDLNTLNRIVLRGSLNYFFTHLDGTSNRELNVPKSQLKRLHIRLNNLLSRIRTPDYLNSGIKGRSHIKNASDHLSDSALVKTDIKSFYRSTTEVIVRKGFSKVFLCTKEVSEMLAKICCVNGHLPTGSPISQSVAFFVNLGMFNHIYGYSKSRDIKFSLYVDDLTFSGKRIPKNFLSYISNYVKKSKGYGCHKFRTYRSSTPKIVTGVVIDNGVLKVKNSHREKIKSLLNKYDQIVENNNFDDKYTRNYFQKLIGSLFSAGQINGRYYQLGKDIVTRRKVLGVKAINQNSK